MFAVGRHIQLIAQLVQLLGGDPALSVGDLLDAAHILLCGLLQIVDGLGRGQQAVCVARVHPQEIVLKRDDLKLIPAEFGSKSN